MRPLTLVGLVVLVLGILSFVVPIPTSKTREFKAGDASVGITTHQEQKVSPVVGGVLCAAGVALILAGSLKTA